MMIKYLTIEHRTFDGLTQFESGAYNSLQHTFDVVEGKFTINDAKTRGQEDSGVSGGKNPPNFGEEYNNVPTKRHVSIKSNGQVSRYGESIDSQVDGLEDERYILLMMYSSNHLKITSKK